VAGENYIAQRPLKIQELDGSVRDIAIGETLTEPEGWVQFRTLLKFGYIKKVEIPRFHCHVCGRDFKNAAGLKRHITRKHKQDGVELQR